MDDGLIDVRILETGRWFARTRILTAMVLGRLQRSPLYHEMQVPQFSFTALDAPTVIAHDGEVGEEYDEATFSAQYRALPVFRPLLQRFPPWPRRRHALLCGHIPRSGDRPQS